MQIDTIETAEALPAFAEFSADPAALEAAAAFLAKRIIERRNTIPILSHVRLEAHPGGTVTLTGTDLDNWASVTIAANVETPGAVCVDAAALADALAKVRKGGAEAVRIADNGAQRVTVKAGRAAFALKALPADDFPRTVTPTMDEALSAFTVPAARFLADLAALAPCISTEETRYYLNGIAFQVRGLGGRERLAMVATDGHCIGAASRPIPAGAEALPDSILPRKTVATIRHAAKLAPDCEAVAVEFEGNRASFTLGPVAIESKLIDGTFPQWERAFEGLAPTGEGDAPMFPELVPGAPLAHMAKIEKGAGQVIEWQEAERGRLGSVPADPGLVFGCVNVTAANEPIKGYRYSYEHDRGMAGRYLIAQAEHRHGPIPFAWSKRLQVEGGEAVGLTVGETKWIPGEYVERPNWETLVVEQVYIEGRNEWCEGAYSVVMPREARRPLGPDVTLQIDGDSTVYPIATNSADKIHLTAEQVRNLAGDSVFETLALTIAGKVVYVLAWLFAQGDSRFLTVRSDGRCFAGKDRSKAQYLTREQVEAALRGEEVTEVVEICPPEPAESDSGPCVVAEAPEAPEALCEAVSAPDEPVTLADELPADPVAALVARVEAIEAQLAASLSVETGCDLITPAGERVKTSHTPIPAVQDRPKRSAAHERAIRRAWVERKARRLAMAIAADHMRMREHLQAVAVSAETCARSAEAREARAIAELADAKRAIESQREVAAAFEAAWRTEQGKRRASTQRARRMIAAARHASTFERQHAARRRASAQRARRMLAESRAQAAHYYANWKEEARREASQGRKRADSVTRARRMIATSRKAATFQRQRADVLAAQLAKAQEDLATAYSEAELQAAVAVERERAASLRADLEAARAEGEGRADGAGVAAAQAAAQMARAIAAEEAVAAVRADLDKERAALAAVTARNARLLQSMADLTERVTRAEAMIAA